MIDSVGINSVLRKNQVVLIAMIILTALALTGAIIAIALYLYEFGTARVSNHTIWGAFGDYMGGVLSPFFALLALIALLLTLRMQSNELAISSLELANSARALGEQSRSLSIQNFENRLFNMISLHHQIVSAIDLRSDGKVTAAGRDCLKVYQKRMRKKILKSVTQRNTIRVGDIQAAIKEGYDSFYLEYSYDLGHYFRNLYRILKFIDESEIHSKSDYSGVVRAQLSNPELVLLYYNGLSSRGIKFKILAERYKFFENLEISELIAGDVAKGMYSQKAFGDQTEAIFDVRDDITNN